jgi:hypothetical protein
MIRVSPFVSTHPLHRIAQPPQVATATQRPQHANFEKRTSITFHSVSLNQEGVERHTPTPITTGRKRKQKRRALRRVRRHRPDKIEPVNRRCNSEQRRSFTLKLRHPQRFRRRPYQHRSAATALGRQRERQIDWRARVDRNLRMEEDASARHVPQLSRVKTRRPLARKTHLHRQENLIAASLSSFTHKAPPRLWMQCIGQTTY